MKSSATHVALAELTWQDIFNSGAAEAWSAAQVPQGYVPLDCTVVHIGPWDLAEAIGRALRAKRLAVLEASEDEEVRPPLLPGGRTLLVPSAAALTLDVGLGYDPTAVAQIKRAGLGIVARPRPALVSTPEAVRGSLELAAETGARDVVFIGNEVVGNPGALTATASALQTLGLRYGMVEMSPQFGADALARLMRGNLIRVHSVSELEMHQLRPAEAIQRYVRAARERGVRLLYVRLVPVADQNILTANADYVERLRRSLEAQGFRAGEPEPVGELSVSLPVRASIGLGAAALAMVLLTAVGLLDRAGWFWAAVALGAASAGLCVFVDMGRYLVALALVVGGATAGLWFVRPPNDECARPLLRALVFLAVASVISVAGASAGAALLSDRLHMSGAAVFRGVKLSLVLPPLLVLLVQAARASKTYWELSTETGGREWVSLSAGLAEVASAAVRYWHVAVGLTALMALALLVVRSGNEPLFGLSGLELKARAATEMLLGVRPRTKEFAVGHPLLLLGLWLLFRGRKREAWLLVSAGAIGQASLANTFCHIHSPYLLSLMRAGVGLVAGALLGLLLVGLWCAGERLCRK
ncbi:MAG: hypothetical protein H5T86_06805 [Armatimonadetes bacterium]|nr:hypothetical protein [Armatimonadota bacterium]